MANSSVKLFLVNLEDPLTKKSYTVSVSADDVKRLETDDYFASLKLEEAKNLAHTKLFISEEDAKTVETLDPEVNFNEFSDGFNDGASGDSAFKWSHEAILLLMEEYRKYQPNFQNGKISQKKLWGKISDRLNVHSHNVTGPQCQSKFSGMKRTYKNIKYHNSKSGNSAKTWPYFTLIDELFGDKLFVVPSAVCSSTGKRTRTKSECSTDSSSSEQDAPSKKNKLAPVDKMLEALEERAKKNETSRERRFNKLLAFKKQKAREDLQLKTRALDLLEKIFKSDRKF